MSWPYSQIKTAVTGDILTATDYNNEHQNHITNNDPSAINDDSATVTAMKATTDPGESGTESLAVTLDGEIQRLRFAIVDMKGTSFWYQTPTKTLAQMLPLSGGTMSGAIAMGGSNITGGGTIAATTVDAGASGTAGTVEVFPTTASKGKTTLTATDNSGNTTTNILTAAQSGARTYTVPDQGANASFLMSGTALVDNARVNAAGYIIGSVVQTQTGTRTTATSTTSATYVTANLSASITPKATTHKIRISVSGSIVNTAGSSVFYTIKRGSTDLDATGNGFGSTGSGTISVTTTCSTVILDAPATTSATTYEVFLRNNSAGATVTWNNNAFTSYILLEEIAF